MSKRILVTGADGFVGGHLLDLLVGDDLQMQTAEIFGMIHPGPRNRLLAHLDDRVHWIAADMTDLAAMTQALEISRPDEVYHLASLSTVGPSWRSPAEYMRVNAGGTIMLFQRLVDLDLKPRVVVSGSADVYDSSAASQDRPICESTPVRAVNPYAASKLAQDAVCTTYHAGRGLPIVRIRAMNHDGPRRPAVGVLAEFARQIARIEAERQSPVLRVGNLDVSRNFTHVADIVRAYQLAMELGRPGEMYLVASENVHTIRECLERLISLSKRSDIQFEVDPAKLRPADRRFTRCDCSKFHDLTGWQPQFSFEQLLEDILEYWRGAVLFESDESI